MNGLAGVGPYISGPNYFGDPFIEKFSGTRDTSFDLFFIWSKLLFFKICCFNYHIISCNFYTKKNNILIESKAYLQLKFGDKVNKGFFSPSKNDMILKLMLRFDLKYQFMIYDSVFKVLYHDF
jgi:hypothetical protein